MDERRMACRPVREVEGGLDADTVPSAEEGLRLLEAFRAIGCSTVRSRILDLVQTERQRWCTKTTH